MQPPYISAKELAPMLGTKTQAVYELARREDDPLPLRFFKGKERNGFVVVEELNAWLERNTCSYNERKAYAKT